MFLKGEKLNKVATLIYDGCFFLMGMSARGLVFMDYMHFPLNICKTTRYLYTYQYVVCFAAQRDPESLKLWELPRALTVHC